MNTKDKAKFLKALADETRISIVEFLNNKEKCVCKIIPVTGKSQPSVSQHLKILYEAGIIEPRKEGTSKYYKIKDKRAIRILEMLKD